MEFRILGPLEAWEGGHEMSLGGPRPRALLALLLLHANEVVSADRLIDELWGEDSPEDAAAALRVNVSRLRKTLPQDVLTTRSPGYVLRVEPDALDLHRFERLVDEGRSLLARGLAADASQRLREALALWRGPALADVAYESFAQAAIARLEEIRVAATELRIDADLALGRHHELVGELEALVAEHPLRERLHGNLMTALYRSGRQADALSAYQDARRALVDGARDRSEPGAPGAGAGDPAAGPALDLARAGACTCPRGRGAVDPRRDRGRDARVDALLAVAEPLVRHPPRVVDPGQARAGARRASARVGPARGAPDSDSRRAMSSSRTASFTSTAAGRGSGSARDRARRRSPARRRARASSWSRELRTTQLTACSKRRPATSPCSFLGTRGPRAPFSSRSAGPTTTGRRSSSARGSRAPSGRRCGSPAPPPCRSKDRRDASRLLSHGALAVQRVLGISAEPLLTPPGEESMLEASRDAGLLVVGLSTRWHREGLGPARLRLAREAIPPTLLVRRGLRPGGLAPPATLTRFTWSIRA